MLKKIILQCQHCGEDVERVRYIENTTCFTCKVERKKLQREGKWKYYDQKKREKLRAIRNAFQSGNEYQLSSKVMMAGRVNKKCKVCGEEMKNVWKTREYCSGKCQTYYSKLKQEKIC